MVTAEELTDAYEAEIQARGIPPIPELREARLSLSAGVLARLPPDPRIAELEAKIELHQFEIAWLDATIADMEADEA